MGAGESDGTADHGDDVMRTLRSGTAAEHETVERALALLDPALDRRRLTRVLVRMHGFWLAAEEGLDDWAARFPDDAAAVGWAARRRAPLFAADVAALGAEVDGSVPGLPAFAGTDEALGRLYVLEGSTLGGRFIDRHLAGLPDLADVRLGAFSPYGAETGRMWHAFRRATRERVAAGGDPAVMTASARATFRALARWCGPASVAA